MRQSTAIGFSLLLAITAACFATPSGERFLVTPLPALAPFERTESRSVVEILLQPDFSVPTHLRPCCAFGRDLQVSLAKLPIPAVQVSNVLDPNHLGHHTYNGGLVSAKHGVRKGFVSTEENGLVYTCGGGFIDLAHVRDYADWTVFLARRLEATLHTGVAMELPEEGARRFIFVTAVDRDLISQLGRRTIAVHLAQWLAFQLSLWHETATWYGWSAIELFPELVSAFSPEDLYSNLLGIHLAAYAIISGEAETERDFNRAMDRAILDVLKTLGAMPPEATRGAFDAVDGVWWDSRERLPSKRLVLRRNISHGPKIRPWRVPAALVSLELEDDYRRYCPTQNEKPALLRYPTEVAGLPFAAIAKLELRIEEPLAGAFPLPDPQSHWLSQREFPAIVDRIRAENAREFGTGHDRPWNSEEAL